MEEQKLERLALSAEEAAKKKVIRLIPYVSSRKPQADVAERISLCMSLLPTHVCLW